MNAPLGPSGLNHLDPAARAAVLGQTPPRVFWDQKQQVIDACPTDRDARNAGLWFDQGLANEQNKLNASMAEMFNRANESTEGWKGRTKAATDSFVPKAQAASRSRDPQQLRTCLIEAQGVLDAVLQQGVEESQQARASIEQLRLTDPAALQRDRYERGLLKQDRLPLLMGEIRKAPVVSAPPARDFAAEIEAEARVLAAAIEDYMEVLERLERQAALLRGPVDKPTGERFPAAATRGL